MNVNQEVSDFLRDAQYKLALITRDMDRLEDDGDVFYQELKQSRWELDMFYSLLLETSQAMQGAYNWLDSAGWTEKDILNEIHYLRNKYRMNGMPVLNYQSSVSQIINYVIEAGAGVSVPAPVGNGDILIGSSGVWVTGSMSSYVGMLDTESLDTYFTGRT